MHQERTLMEMDHTEARLNTHEAICKERYESICARLSRLEKIMIGMTGGILFILIHIALKMS
jgi:hypothetical protein